MATEEIQDKKQKLLSLKGKICIINSLAVSKLIYPISVLHVPSKVIQEVDNILFKFLWNNKTPKISKHVIIGNIEDGGLKMVDFKSKIKSAKVSWIRRLIDSTDAAWKHVANNMNPNVTLSHLVTCKLDIKLLEVKLPKFYLETIHCWNEINNFEPTSISDIYNESLWLNKNIIATEKKSKNTKTHKMLLWKNWLKNGVIYIKHLLNDNGDFL